MKNTKTVDEVIQETRNLIDEAKRFLIKQSGEAIILDEWLTVKRYCERFNIENTQTVTNWISRGIIPPENIQVVEELNGLRLIKAVPYL